MGCWDCLISTFRRVAPKLLLVNLILELGVIGALIYCAAFLERKIMIQMYIKFRVHPVILNGNL